MWLEKMNALEDPLAEMQDLKTSMWERITSAAERHNVPSSFTALIGNTLGPEKAFHFAKGDVVTSSMGMRARLRRPLDWLVIADHAEGFGVAPMLAASDPKILSNDFGRRLHELAKAGTPEATAEAWNLWAGSRMEEKNPFSNNPEFSEAPWEKIIDAAETATVLGSFSALIGFEWSSTPNGNNMHPVVVYRDGKDVANNRTPLSADANPDPEALWDWMEKTGGRVLVYT